MQQKQTVELTKNPIFRPSIEGFTSLGISLFVPHWLWIWGYFVFISSFVLYQNFNSQNLESVKLIQLGVFFTLMAFLHQFWFLFGTKNPKIKLIFLVAGFLQILVMGMTFWGYFGIF